MWRAHGTRNVFIALTVPQAQHVKNDVENTGGPQHVSVVGLGGGVRSVLSAGACGFGLHHVYSVFGGDMLDAR